MHIHEPSHLTSTYLSDYRFTSGLHKYILKAILALVMRLHLDLTYQTRISEKCRHPNFKNIFFPSNVPSVGFQ